MKCKDCGKTKTWIFISREGAVRKCACEVDLSNATLLPRGMSSFLDERMDWIKETLTEFAA